MSGSVPLDIPTRFGSTSTHNCETTISRDLSPSPTELQTDYDDETDDFDFYPSIPRREGIDLGDFGDLNDFPTSFTFIPLVTKTIRSEVVRPSHRYKVALRERRHRAPELQILPYIYEESE